MLSTVASFIQKKHLFTSGDLLIVAVSGGKDSMALLHYLKEEGYAVVAAHCNFKLRGAESDADEQFVEKYCELHQIPFKSIHFDTEVIAKERRLSIQEVARNLRYDWLETIRKEAKAVAIVTAHHLNDNMETLFFNLTKGTGIKGLRGMLPKKGHLVRPFLETDVQEIWDYIQSHTLQYRDDASNALTKYDRNKIRHEVIPVLEEINPSLHTSFLEHFRRWRDIEIYQQVILSEWRAKLFEPRGEEFFISIAKLAKLDFNRSLLFELLQPYNFNQTAVDDLLNSLDATDAKLFESTTHQLIKDRKFLVLRAKELIKESQRFLIQKTTKKVVFGNDQLLRVHLKPIKQLARMSSKKNYAYIDTANLSFPLLLRKWEAGDYFYPIGLSKASGKPSKKKIGKFLRDEKMSLHQKENTWVLSSGAHIVWLLGHRLDDRFKVTNQTEEVLEIELQ